MRAPPPLIHPPSAQVLIILHLNKSSRKHQRSRKIRKRKFGSITRVRLGVLLETARRTAIRPGTASPASAPACCGSSSGLKDRLPPQQGRGESRAGLGNGFWPPASPN